MTSDEKFNFSISAILKHEGGYSNHPSDSGGPTNYGISFRLLKDMAIDINHDDKIDFDDIKGGSHRVDILERSYEGSLEEVCAGPTPMILRVNKDLNNKYDSVIFTEVELQLLNEVSQQFIELFGADDQKYKVNYYFDESGFVLKWTGYILPDEYSEPLVLPKNYYTTIKASDNLAILQNEDYYDDNGNIITGTSSLLFIIQTLVEKTGLRLNLRSFIDLIEAGMDATDSDDVLSQTYINNVIFYDEKGTPNKSIDVLDKILKPFGAQLFQSDGIWCIRRVEKSIGNIPYREYDWEGNFITDDIYQTNKGLEFPSDADFNAGDLVWRDATQALQLLKNYGTVTLIQDLALDNNLIDSGSFEEQYLVQLGSGDFFFDGWNIYIGQSGLSYGLEQVSNGDSKGALYLDYDSVSGGGADSSVYTKKIPIINTGLITIKFQYQVVPVYNMPFIRIGYRVKLTNPDESVIKYLFVTTGEKGAFIDDSSGVDDWNNSGYINEIYVESYGSWQNFEKSFNLPVSVVGWNIEFSFYFYNHYGAEIEDTDFSLLRDVETSSRLQGIRRKYYFDPNDDVIYDYMLEPSGGTESESLPDIVEPDDYGVGNQSRWKRKNTIIRGANQSFVDKFLIDNFSIGQKIFINSPYTILVTPPETIEYKEVSNQYNLNKLSETVYLGDLPEDIENGELIYNGWLRLVDDTPTNSWTRRGLTEDKFLIQILLEDRIAQLSSQTKRLLGNGLSTEFISYINSITYEGERFLINGYDVDIKQCNYGLDLLNVTVGDDGEAPPYTRAYSSGFSSGFF